MDLRSFISECIRLGDFMEIDEEVSPIYEIPRIMKEHDGGPLLLFNKVRGSDMKIVANVCSNRMRLLRSLNVESDLELYERIINSMNSPLRPKVTGNDYEDLRETDLGRLPILKHYEKDGGNYITAGIVLARDPETGYINASFHRLMVIGKDELAIRLVPRHLYAIHMKYKSMDIPTPIAISIGNHPIMMLAAACSPPFGISEMDVANSMAGGAIKAMPCRIADITVPYGCEMVLEGRILRDVEVPEGASVDVTGTYDMVRMQPLVKISKICLRHGASYQALLPAGSEHRLLMGMEKEARIWDYVRRIVPEVKGVRLTAGGCGWLHAVISLRKLAEGDGKNAILAAFSAHPSLKHVVVVDEDIDVDDPLQVEWAIATRFRADKGLLLITSVRGSTVDPSSDDGLTAKMGMDATVPFDRPREMFERGRIP